MSAPAPLITDLLLQNKGKRTVSFEFYPPRTDAGEVTMMETTVPSAARQNPIFMDLTWGAGGRSSETTMRICKQMQEQYPSIPINMHLTCVNMPSGLIKEALDFAKSNNIRNICALRGDPPAGQEFAANPDGFACALDLVRYIRKEYGDFFCVCVAGYPEGHPEVLTEGCRRATDENFEKEMAYLKEKVDAGADFIITQLFYDADLFIDFVKKCRQVGIQVPILPGYLPVTRYASLKRMVDLCKTYIPPEVQAKVEELKDDNDKMAAYGVQQCAEMIRKIEAADIGIHNLHFYTVNNMAQSFAVMKEMGCLVE